MRVGIDFGTTRTVVALVDRGNYPILGFTDADGDSVEHFPTVIAWTGGRVVYGFEAQAAARAGAPALRSVKRLLGAPDVRLDSEIALGERTFPLAELIVGFLSALREAIAEATGSPEPLQAVVTVPAHAHTAQRFGTLTAFRQAGFDVLAMVNEPSAAGFEYTHRQSRTVTAKRTQVLVYDLGGGTFDASLVEADGTAHDVLGSVGIPNLGGDDFDTVLVDTALAAAGRSATELSPAEHGELLTECQQAKERILPQTRRIVVEVAGEPVVIGVDAFYRAAEPLVRQTISAMEPLVGAMGDGLEQVAGVYLVGGSSGLPLVPRIVKDTFGRRVFRSAYPGAATAIGAAIAADPDAGFTLNDRLSRGLGVFRESAFGTELVFDQLVGSAERLPASGKATVTRTYQAAHNVAHFRYVEYGRLGPDGTPLGEIVPFADVVMPFDPELQDGRDLAGVPIRRRPDGPWVRETYSLDADGLIGIHIEDLHTGYSQVFDPAQ